MNLHTRVGKGLIFLAACNAVIIAFMFSVALWAIDGLVADSRRMYEFQLQAIAAIGQAMHQATKLKEGAVSAPLAAFVERYESGWAVATAANPDAARFRNILRAAGESDLPKREIQVLADLKESLQSGNAQDVREKLAALHWINTRYAELDNHIAVEHAKSARVLIMVTGILGTGLALSLGLLNYYSVVPRARVLVERVRRFQETGVHDRIGDMGKDFIGMLANALDAGMSAIAQRETEREQFLAIAAHELKTPLTSIQGYASLVVSHPDAAPLLHRALEVINRQSWRLSRLIDGLFLAMRARSKDLRFTPKPFDMSRLVERVLDEMKPFFSNKAFSSCIQKNICILGDEALLEQALWSLFTCASALSTSNSPVKISFDAEEWRAVLIVNIDGNGTSIPEMEELFQPFRSIEYETGASVRLTTGLYLCREIVRVHNGQLRVQQFSQEEPEFAVELPI